MGKLPKPKSREPSLHSRAARRATSPSLNTDKSLKDVKPPASNPHVHIFAAKNAGIKKKKQKQMTRGQLSRQRKGVERADVVKERLELKVQKSMCRLKVVRDRRKEWDVLNDDVTTAGGVRGFKAKKSKFAALDDEEIDMDVHPVITEDGFKNDHAVELPHRPAEMFPLPPDDADEIL